MNRLGRVALGAAFATVGFLVGGSLVAVLWWWLGVVGGLMGLASALGAMAVVVRRAQTGPTALPAAVGMGVGAVLAFPLALVVDLIEDSVNPDPSSEDTALVELLAEDALLAEPIPGTTHLSGPHLSAATENFFFGGGFSDNEVSVAYRLSDKPSLIAARSLDLLVDTGWHLTEAICDPPSFYLHATKSFAGQPAHLRVSVDAARDELWLRIDSPHVEPGLRGAHDTVTTMDPAATCVSRVRAPSSGR